MDRRWGSDISFKKSLFKCVRGSSSLFCRVSGAVNWKRTLETRVHSRALESVLQPLGFGSFWKGWSVDPSGWDTHYQLLCKYRRHESAIPSVPFGSTYLPQVQSYRSAACLITVFQQQIERKREKTSHGCSCIRGIQNKQFRIFINPASL